jgi:NADP-dependent 3-hydroxy acid dehydrogenase YdfG
MRKTGSGFIVHLSSLAGRNPFAGGAAYNASKFGLNGMSEAMMLDHRNENIRVTTIMPGSVDTDFSPRSSREPSEWKIAPADVAAMVIAVLSMPARTLVSRVEMRPSRPPK